MSFYFLNPPKGPQVRRVALVLFDPLVKTPAIDPLMAGYLDDLHSLSGQLITYELLPAIVSKEFPILQGGRRYTLEDYNAALADDSKAYRQTKEQYLMADYEKVLGELNLLQQLRARQADEIWFWGDKYFGFWESIMGGWLAFKCNAPDVIHNTWMLRRFVVMAFNFTCGNGEMLESFGHRAEAILAQRFNSRDFLNSLYDGRRVHPELLVPRNDFERFLLEHGTVHRLPEAPKTPPPDNNYWWGGMDIREHHRAWLAGLKPEWWALIV